MKKMMKFAAMAVAAIALCVACEPEEKELEPIMGGQFTWSWDMGDTDDEGNPVLYAMALDFGKTVEGQLAFLESLANYMPEDQMGPEMKGKYMVSGFVFELVSVVADADDPSQGVINISIPPMAYGQQPQTASFTYTDYDGNSFIFTAAELEIENVKCTRAVCPVWQDPGMAM